MALGRKTTTRTALVVSLSAGILKVKGTPYTFRRGEKLAADHPLVKAYPAMFAPDGLTTAEYEQAAHAYRYRGPAAA